MTTPFVLSIEPVEGPSFREGYHLGTDESFARAEAETRFKARNAYGLPTRTVALMQGGKVWDCFDGEWASDRANAMWDEIAEGERQMIEDSAA